MFSIGERASDFANVQFGDLKQFPSHRVTHFFQDLLKGSVLSRETTRERSQINVEEPGHV